MTEPEAPAAPAEPTLLERLRAAPITLSITAVNVAVFVYAEYFAGGTESMGTLLRFGALEPAHVWAGEYWRVVTSMFLHIGLIHIAVNTYMSIGWSTALERVLGKVRFLFLYLASGIAGSFLSVLMGFLFTPSISAGASGALFGVVGATLALRRRMLPDWRAFFADRGVRSILVQFALLTAVGHYAHFDNSAHAGGLLSGAAIAAVMTSRPPRTPRWVALAVVYAALALGAFRPWWTPTGELAEWTSAFVTEHLDGRLEPDRKARPSDIASGLRIGEKACTRGVALSCRALANHLYATGEPANVKRALEYEQRTCDLDPALCRQQF